MLEGFGGSVDPFFGQDETLHDGREMSKAVFFLSTRTAKQGRGPPEDRAKELTDR